MPLTAAFQFPQLRVRYITQKHRLCKPHRVSIPATAGKIHAEGERVSYTYMELFQFPQLRVRYIPIIRIQIPIIVCFNSRSCG